MTFKDVLVLVDDTAAAQARAVAAAALAARHGAALTGLFLTSDFLETVLIDGAGSYAPALDLTRLAAEHAAAVLSASETARLLFEAAAGQAGVRSDWLTVPGGAPENLFATARRFDLTVFPNKARACLGPTTISAAALGMASGGPILVLPDGVVDRPVGHRIMVAWKAARESARALHDAWPLLSKADEVHAVVVSPHGEYGPDGALQRHLERHGVPAKVIVDLSRDADAGEVLRREALNLNADLIVMGLYGRTRVGEVLLGGVSDSLLHNPPCALLLSH